MICESFLQIDVNKKTFPMAWAIAIEMEAIAPGKCTQLRGYSIIPCKPRECNGLNRPFCGICSTNAGAAMAIRMICIDQSLKNGPGYLLAGGSYRVGRSSRCSFIVNDLSVSRFHAELKAKETTVHLKDMGSRNGTFVDGVRIEEMEVPARPARPLRQSAVPAHGRGSKRSSV